MVSTPLTPPQRGGGNLAGSGVGGIMMGAHVLTMSAYGQADMRECTPFFQNIGAGRGGAQGCSQALGGEGPAASAACKPRGIIEDAAFFHVCSVNLHCYHIVS